MNLEASIFIGRKSDFDFQREEVIVEAETISVAGVGYSDVLLDDDNCRFEAYSEPHDLQANDGYCESSSCVEDGQ